MQQLLERLSGSERVILKHISAKPSTRTPWDSMEVRVLVNMRLAAVRDGLVSLTADGRAVAALIP
jgi:hypothetical protein